MEHVLACQRDGARGDPQPAYPLGYGASKAELINATKGLAVELASRGVRADCVCPRTVLTPLTIGVGESLPPDLDPAPLRG